MTLPLVKISPLKCLCMMTSSDRAVSKKIVEIRITDIFIFPLIILDDILDLSQIDHFPGRGEERRGVRSGLGNCRTPTDQCVVCSAAGCTWLLAYSPTVRLRHQQPSLDYFISHQQTSPLTRQSVKLSNQHEQTQIRHSQWRNSPKNLKN